MAHKVGKYLSKEGYIRLSGMRDHPLADKSGYVYEHRLVASLKYGLSVVMNGVIHHIDHNKLNNSPKNLMLLANNSEHSVLHREKQMDRQYPNEDNYLIKCECGCNEELLRFGKDRNPRRFIVAHWRRGEYRNRMEI